MYKFTRNSPFYTSSEESRIKTFASLKNVICTIFKRFSQIKMEQGYFHSSLGQEDPQNDTITSASFRSPLNKDFASEIKKNLKHLPFF